MPYIICILINLYILRFGVLKRKKTLFMPSKLKNNTLNWNIIRYSSQRHRSMYVTIGQDRTGKDRTRQDGTGEERRGQDGTGHDMTWHDRANFETKINPRWQAVCSGKTDFYKRFARSYRSILKFKLHCWKWNMFVLWLL